MPDGKIYYGDQDGYKIYSNSFVWPVRSGYETNPTTTSQAELWQTGQTTSYAIGDDGDLQKGVPWPSPRFTNNADGTVTDNLTGLVWTQNANLAGNTKTWEDALAYVIMMNAGIVENFGHRDWHLPNRKELHSLTDFAQTSPALPPGHPFANVKAYYWSSTTYALSTVKAWYVNMYFGYTDSNFYKSSSDFCYVWPVRLGVISDSDNDGMSDDWEQQIVDAKPDDDITSIDDVNPNDDFDNDGYSNLIEYQKKTDPTDPLSHPSKAMPWIPLLLLDD